MKKQLPLKSAAVALIFTISSCATTKYSGDPLKDDFTQLKAGKTYTFHVKDGKLPLKMVYLNQDSDNLMGMKSKSDSTKVMIPKRGVTSSTDRSKAAIQAASYVVGAAAVTALIIGSTRATSN